GLYQCRDQLAEVICAGPGREVLQSFHARLAGFHFEVHQVELAAEFGMGVTRVFTHTHHGLIESQSRFHANYCEVESIRQSNFVPVLPLFDHSLENESRQHKPESADSDKKRKGVEA